MNYDDRMHKLKNGSDTARWAADEIEPLRAKLEAQSGEAVAWVAGSHDVRALKDLSGLEYGTILFTSPPAAKVPEGYALVPVEPTEEMISAMCSVECKDCYGDCKNGPYRAMYKAMLSAQGGEK